MPATIQIDDEVQATLANLAIERGLDVFSPDTPNIILRGELGVEKATRLSPLPTPHETENETVQSTPRRQTLSPHSVHISESAQDLLESTASIVRRGTSRRPANPTNIRMVSQPCSLTRTDT